MAIKKTPEEKAAAKAKRKEEALARKAAKAAEEAAQTAVDSKTEELEDLIEPEVTEETVTEEATEEVTEEATEETVTEEATENGNDYSITPIATELIEDNTENVVTETEVEETKAVANRLSGDIRIKKLFKYIEEQEKVTIPYNEVYAQKTKLSVTSKDGGRTKIVGFMRKKAKIAEVRFTDGSVLKAADKHILIQNGENVFVDALSVGDTVDTVDGTREVQSIEIGKKRTVYDIQVEDGSHLYADASGLIHHNTYDVTTNLKSNGFTVGDNLMIFGGSGSAASLFATLYYNADGGAKHKFKIIMFDDYDAILKDPDAVNFLKAALDSTQPTVVSKSTSDRDTSNFDPKKYGFEGDFRREGYKTVKGLFPDSSNPGWKVIAKGMPGEEQTQTAQSLIHILMYLGWGKDDIDSTVREQHIEFSRIPELRDIAKASDFGNYKNQAAHKTAKDIRIIVGEFCDLDKRAELMLDVYLGLKEAPEDKDGSIISVSDAGDELSTKILKPKLPSSFCFTNRVIFITNESLESKLLAPLLSRSGKMEINLSASDLVERIEQIYEGGGFAPLMEEFSITDKMIKTALDAFKVLRDKNPEDMSGDLNVRKFTQAVGVHSLSKHIKGDANRIASKYYA